MAPTDRTSSGSPSSTEFREALKTVAAVLKEHQVRFALAGGYAGWARGGPESDHDVDFAVHHEDVPRAWNAIEKDSHTRLVDSPEDWLFKAAVGDVPVDLVHVLPVGQVDAGVLDRATTLAVESVRMPVLAATDLLACKLLPLDEHSCDLAPVLALSRSIREQVDWPALAYTTRNHPIARRFLDLLADLEIIDGSALE